ncbi:MAG TPA: hypothetical protein VIV57_24685 [Anaeromyxobacter sp.]
MEGIPFVAERGLHHAISGLRIDVQEVWGRESLVAYHSELGGSC